MAKKEVAPKKKTTPTKAVVSKVSPEVKQYKLQQAQWDIAMNHLRRAKDEVAIAIAEVKKLKPVPPKNQKITKSK